MNKIVSKISEVGWNFDNSYSHLPETMLSHQPPDQVQKPKLIILNYTLSKELGLDFSFLNDEDIASIFSGNLLPKGTEPIAQAYAGHQFGHLSMLGDGRAILMGEHITPDNKRIDIQFKGSGKTPYARGGDGKAALGPMLREYIISEAMYGLNIPTTRSLAVVTTGEKVFRETPLIGSILTRIATSHIRVGTFQYVGLLGDVNTLKVLVDYTIDRHCQKRKSNNSHAIILLESVIQKQIELITNWMRVGFIHGVMNTDNMSISGETIDYGPCAFMNTYDPQTVFSSIDHYGRYAYANQPVIAHWNLSRLAEILLPLIDDNQDKAIKIAKQIIDKFTTIYKKHWIQMMRNKLGLFGKDSGDEVLITELLSWMQQNKADYTNTFLFLMNEKITDAKIFQNDTFLNWFQQWKKRIKKNNKPEKLSLKLMQLNNPLVIPRNHKVEEALEAAVNDDFVPMNNLLKVLKDPYNRQLGIENYQQPPGSNEQYYKTFCGT